MTGDAPRPPAGTAAAGDGRLRARPGPVTGEAEPERGLQRLGLAAERDGLLYVPAGYTPARPSPLVVMLHGARQEARNSIAPLLRYAERFGLILLAPDSRGPTWDRVRGHFGPDVAFIDGALALVFGRYAIDPNRLAVGGFSDGASYALSLGITNGDLFTDVLAFSPGFVAPAAGRGRPRLFIAHGRWDTVLPIDRCSRKIVPRLERAGYAVHYREFWGPHMVPRSIARNAAEWFLTKQPRTPH